MSAAWRRIDVHHHIVPPRYAKELRDRGIRPGGVEPPAWSVARSRRLMDAVGIQTALLSVSTPGVWFGDAAEARFLAREVNEVTAAVVEADQDRFGFFATLTLPDVPGAIAEARYALDELHADGVVILANSAGVYLGDERLEPLMAELNQRDAIVFVHPGDLPGGSVAGILPFTADFLLDTTRAAINLILTGTLERYPRIRFILAHAGGFVPYVSFRILLSMLKAEGTLAQLKAMMDKEHEIERRLDLIRRFYFDVALSSTHTTLPSLLAVAKPTHVLYGTDFPFAPGPAVKLMASEYEHYPLDGTQRAAIDRGNALRLFPRFATAGDVGTGAVRQATGAAAVG